MSDFFQYIKESFSFSEKEIQVFKEVLYKPLTKSIRVNTNKISVDQFQKQAQKKWWKLIHTWLWNNVFYVERSASEIALWSTIEHITWLFYIQEVAASSSVSLLSNNKIDDWDYTILDMSASPWWKTTQLAEQYPNSLIIANEPTKSRFEQLFFNLNRMGCLNVCVTNYDWRHFWKLPEAFDKIILDAPCSWEGTAYKSDSLKFWNIKKIKRISKLQFGLIDSAFKTLKTWGEMVYSTCTLNKLENEWVVEKLLKKYPDSLIIHKDSEWIDWTFWKRMWPHIDWTWWFFSVKLIKTKPIETQKEKKIYDTIYRNLLFERLPNKDTKSVISSISKDFWFSINKLNLFKNWNEIALSSKNPLPYFDNLYFMKIWINIWSIENSQLIPSWDFSLLPFDFENNVYIFSVNELEKFMQWYDLENTRWLSDWYYQVKHNNLICWLVKVTQTTIKNMLPSKFVLK